SDAGLPIVGVPKTIDNDIAATDVTFGFDTAGGGATDPLDRLKTPAESPPRVLVGEAMGRDTGRSGVNPGGQALAGLQPGPLPRQRAAGRAARAPAPGGQVAPGPLQA
ncbi:6-phosphofructokinase, partial [Streptomyces rimosus]|uniref:6-phosphofructokinase n=1 Tax=Streptomyces rimosus TaxID=1927 RepID=UPI0006C72964